MVKTDKWRQVFQFTIAFTLGLLVVLGFLRRMTSFGQADDTIARREAVSNSIDTLLEQYRNDGDAQAVDRLKEAATSNYDFERQRAYLALAKIGGDAKNCIPIVAGALDSNDPYERDAAAHALAVFGAEAESVERDLLAAAVKYKNESAGMWAVRASGTIGSDDPGLVDTLRGIAASPDTLRKKTVVDVIKKLEDESIEKSDLFRMREQYKDEQGRVRKGIKEKSRKNGN